MPNYDAERFDPPAPFAQLSLRHPINRQQSTNVFMLLDSGADATLIPRKALSSLELEVDASQVYELLAFDGTVSYASPVQLDLIFLNRVFYGRYLVVEAEWGVLGRDILNFVPVVLNGPALTWHEFRQTR
ncbi:MAG: hypothetical protein KF770_22230 [Anaerolineae bacterium]|nr:hypothetical protein [Anaerolineae bacterium]